jgi:outer membrane protein assembly factor BamB
MTRQVDTPFTPSLFFTRLLPDHNCVDMRSIFSFVVMFTFGGGVASTISVFTRRLFSGVHQPSLMDMRLGTHLLGVCVCVCCALGGNWPEWRGPTRDGVSPERNLLTRWSATQNVKWKTALPSPGNSTPIIWGNRVFVTQAVPEEDKRQLFCFDRESGRVLWQRGTVYREKEESHETNPLCSSSPATDGEQIFTWFGSAGLFAYDLSGKELWRKELGKQSHEWGYASSPVIHKDTVFLNFGPGDNSFLAAFDKKNGNELWRVKVEATHSKARRDGFNGQDNGVTGSWSTPIVVQSGTRDELVITLADKMSGFDPRNGKELWFVRGLNPLIYTSPVFGEGVIVGNGGFHGPDLIVRPGGNGDVTATHKVWESGKTANRLGSCVIKDGYFFLPTMPGIAECIELKTGKTVWNERIRGSGAKNDIWSSFVLSDDNIYALNQSGDTVILRASPKFEIVAVNSIGNEMCNASLAVADNDLFIRTHSNLWCISRATQTASR